MKWSLTVFLYVMLFELRCCILLLWLFKFLLIVITLYRVAQFNLQHCIFVAHMSCENFSEFIKPVRDVTRHFTAIVQEGFRLFLSLKAREFCSSCFFMYRSLMCPLTQYQTINCTIASLIISAEILIHSNHFSLSFHRMFTSYPGTKTYFSHLDISPRSPHMLSHGKKIVLAIAEGSRDISQLAVSLGPLQTLHAYQLRIHPPNFKVPSVSMPDPTPQSIFDDIKIKFAI